jgi:hypothetical protein
MGVISIISNRCGSADTTNSLDPIRMDTIQNSGHNTNSYLLQEPVR